MSKSVDLQQEGIEVKKSCCYFCHQNCGVLAYVKDGRVLEIEGDPSFPTNEGGLCCRGNIALKHLDNPARVNYPLKRVGKRARGQMGADSVGSGHQ
jgi:anaerobic selenocysteine-containing dehydrogenase